MFIGLCPIHARSTAAYRSAVSYLVRQVKARCRAEPDTAELVRRVTLAEAPR
ncbi:MAG: hypothetical protein PHE10_03100 [Kiritimatiellae bacterium]|nr:hypothetical protein [Kiritimatiellia bacterium]